MPVQVLKKDKKYVWDGMEYPDKETALEKAKKYKSEGFEVETLEEGGKLYLYTRRVAREVLLS
ncbi:MAG: hypothetical protein N3G78_03685 [Desulfobacterota bacterium]|nr:hypothetical protein [Thermodesulfobacteriota bacterium]